jgi:hypothetical protein
MRGCERGDLEACTSALGSLVIPQVGTSDFVTADHMLMQIRDEAVLAQTSALRKYALEQARKLCQDDSFSPDSAAQACLFTVKAHRGGVLASPDPELERTLLRRAGRLLALGRVTRDPATVRPACAPSAVTPSPAPRASASTTSRSPRPAPARSSSTSAPPASTSPTSCCRTASTSSSRRPRSSPAARRPASSPAVGDGVTDLAPGDRVATTMIHGAFAERLVVPASRHHQAPGRRPVRGRRRVHGHLRHDDARPRRPRRH